MNEPFNILIVDDNQKLVRSLRDILQENGYVTSWAFDGNSAIECSREAFFDLVLIDFNLPDMDGLALQERLSVILNADYIIITGYASIESAAEAVHRKQIVGYEIKPLVIDRLLAFIQQVADRRKAEAESRKIRRELDTIFNAARALIWNKDGDGRYVRVNRAYCETIGMPEERMIGKTDHDLFPLDIAEYYAENDRKVIKSGKPEYGIEEPHLKPDGERGWSLSDKLPCHDAKGNIDGTIGFALDITERKQSEETIKNSLAEKETLLRELYHRTKNNMQVIISMLSLQSSFLQDKTTKTILMEIENKIQSMALVHQKLYQAKDLSRIDLREYIQDLANLLIKSYSISPERIALRLDMEKISILIDTAVPCGLIINELISNAFKHAFPDGKQGEVRITLLQTDQGIIELTIADTGVGVPAGFDCKKQKSLGLRTVFMIAERQLSGTVSFDGTNGLSCRIQFQDIHYKERI